MVTGNCSGNLTDAPSVRIVINLCGQNFLWFKPILWFIISWFVTVNPCTESAVRKFCDKNFHNFCTIHENHKNIRSWKFGVSYSFTVTWSHNYSNSFLCLYFAPCILISFEVENDIHASFCWYTFKLTCMPTGYRSVQHKIKF